MFSNGLVDLEFKKPSDHGFVCWYNNNLIPNIGENYLINLSTYLGIASCTSDDMNVDYLLLYCIFLINIRFIIKIRNLQNWVILILFAKSMNFIIFFITRFCSFSFYTEKSFFLSKCSKRTIDRIKVQKHSYKILFLFSRTTFLI